MVSFKVGTLSSLFASGHTQPEERLEDGRLSQRRWWRLRSLGRRPADLAAWLIVGRWLKEGPHYPAIGVHHEKLSHREPLPAT